MLEQNKIHLGDAYKLIKFLPDKSIDLIYTDIPYLYTKGGAGGGTIGKKFSKRDKELTDIKNGIDYSIFNDFIRVCKKFNCFIWCSRLQINGILNFFLSKGYLYNLLVWAKTNPIPAAYNRYLDDLEYCLHFREPGIGLNNGIKLKSKFYISPTNQKDKLLFEHPTIKPLPLVERHILHTSKANGLVLDPFIGSGTTAVAALNTDRNFIGFEKDKRWHSVAYARLNGINAYGQTSFILR